MVRQQQAQAITPPLAGVHIGTEAFAVAGTNECMFLHGSRTLIAILGLDYEPRLCDRGAVTRLRPSDFWWPFASPHPGLPSCSRTTTSYVTLTDRNSLTSISRTNRGGARRRSC